MRRSISICQYFVRKHRGLKKRLISRICFEKVTHFHELITTKLRIIGMRMF